MAIVVLYWCWGGGGGGGARPVAIISITVARLPPWSAPRPISRLPHQHGVMMGLAVGIVRPLHHRAVPRTGERPDVEAAIAMPGATANRAVLFSGVTVVLAPGLLFVPVTVFFAPAIWSCDHRSITGATPASSASSAITSTSSHPFM
jgi:hypothetical protein